MWNTSRGIEVPPIAKKRYRTYRAACGLHSTSTLGKRVYGQLFSVMNGHFSLLEQALTLATNLKNTIFGTLVSLLLL